MSLVACHMRHVACPNWYSCAPNTTWVQASDSSQLWLVSEYLYQCQHMLRRSWGGREEKEAESGGCSFLGRSHVICYPTVYNCIKITHAHAKAKAATCYESKHVSVFWNDPSLPSRAPVPSSHPFSPLTNNCPIQFNAMFNILYIFVSLLLLLWLLLLVLI